MKRVLCSTYRYHGPVRQFGTKLGDVNFETQAPSRLKAISNFKSQAKKAYNRSQSAIVMIDEDLVEEVELVPQNDLTKDIKPRCEQCGRLLTDSGLCPVCDDGEADY